MAVFETTTSAGVNSTTLWPSSASVIVSSSQATSSTYKILLLNGTGLQYLGSGMTYATVLNSAFVPVQIPVTGTYTSISLLDGNGFTLATLTAFSASASQITQDPIATVMGGADLLIGGAGRDTLNGFGGEDTIDGRGGADEMFGSTGNDVYVVDSKADAIAESGGDPGDELRTTLTPFFGDSFFGVEKFTFIGVGNAGVTGTAIDNVIKGGAGDDGLDGGDGADTLIGGGGSDSFAYFKASSITGDSIDGGADGASGDAIEIFFSGTADFSSTNTVTIGSIGGTSIERLRFFNPGSHTAIFDASQFGVSGVSTALQVLGVENETDIVRIKNVNGAFSAASFGFSSWNPAADRIEIIAGNGADSLTGSVQNDSLSGFGGADTLDGGAGADTLAGGAGNDVYIVDSASDVIVEAAGDTADEVRTTLDVFTLGLTAGSANVENLTFTGVGAFYGGGNNAANVITGGGGDDTLPGLAGADTLIGGDGSDFFSTGSNEDLAGDSIDGGAGGALGDVLGIFFTGIADLSGANGVRIASSGTTSIERIDLGDGSHDVYLDASQFSGTGVAANLSIRSQSSGANTITIKGADTSFSAAAFQFIGEWNSAVDRIVINGGDNADSIRGSSQADSITGNGGDDTLYGSPGADTLVGGSGSDVFAYFSQGDITGDIIDGGADGALGDAISVNFAGPADFTSVSFGLGGASSIEALLLFGSGHNVIFNADQFGTSRILNGLEIQGASGTDTVTINNVNGSFGAEAFRFVNDPQAGVAWDPAVDRIVINGGDNADSIRGSSQNDSLNGNGGADTLDGGAGADTLTGGAGDDVYIVDSGSDFIVEGAGDANDEVRTTLNAFQLRLRNSTGNVEHLTFTGAGNFIGEGNGAANRITGGGGDDTLLGGAAADTLTGAGGNDRLDGGQGDDRLDGGEGVDTIIFTGTRANYSVAAIANGFIVTDNRGAGFDGVDTVLNAETFVFTDQTRNALTLANLPPSQAAFIQPAALPENAAAGTVVGELNAFDLDGNPLTFTLDAAGAALFDLVGNQLRIKAGANIDFEAGATRGFTAFATDPSGARGPDANLTLTLANVNEAPGAPSLAGNTVAENAAPGTVVGTLSASDPEGNPVTFTLDAAGAALFDLVGNELRIKAGANIDFEAGATRSFAVTAADPAGLAGPPTLLTLNITNVNEAPGAPSLAGNTVAENAAAGTVIGTLSASDPDGTSPGFRITGGSGASVFAISGNSLVVAPGAVLDFEALPSRTIEIASFDGALGSAAQTFTVTLTDAQEGDSGGIRGLDVADFLNGTPGADVIAGNGGNDTVRGLGGPDALYGHADNDVLIGDGPLLLDAQAQTVRRLYIATLDRGPDDAGWQDWTGRLTNGQPLDDIAAGFVGSQEFLNRYGNLDNSGFVTLLYRNVLDREPDAGGLAAFTGALDTGALTRTQVVTSFSESPELRAGTAPELHAGQVFRLYGATLARQPDSGGFETWTDALGNGRGLAEVAGGFVGSVEFQSVYGALDTTGFVTLLYQNVLGRAPDAGGLAFWSGQLDAGAQSRTQVVTGFSESTEYINGTRAGVDAFMRNVMTVWSDTLTGGPGDDRMTGGRGSDRFVFTASEGGADSIFGFESFDTLDLTGFGFASPAQALAAVSQQGANAVLAYSGGSITFVDTQVGLLQGLTAQGWVLG